jgi:hypothetical protein
MPNETEIRPLRVDMPSEATAELQRRIAATRWPSQELVADRSQDVQLATLQPLSRQSGWVRRRTASGSPVGFYLLIGWIYAGAVRHV